MPYVVGWSVSSFVWMSLWGWYFRIGSCRWAPKGDEVLGWFCVPHGGLGGWVSLVSLDLALLVILSLPLAVLAFLAVTYAVRHAPR